MNLQLHNKNDCDEQCAPMCAPRALSVIRGSTRGRTDGTPGHAPSGPGRSIVSLSLYTMALIAMQRRSSSALGVVRFCEAGPRRICARPPAGRCKAVDAIATETTRREARQSQRAPNVSCCTSSPIHVLQWQDKRVRSDVVSFRTEKHQRGAGLRLSDLKCECCTARGAAWHAGARRRSRRRLQRTHR
jgi:hypothetical protein